MKVLYLILVVVIGLFLGYGIIDMPKWGDPQAPASTRVSPRYIEDSFKETGVPNMVTAVLADYRSFDTFGETAVIFTAGICCFLILKNRKDNGA